MIIYNTISRGGFFNALLWQIQIIFIKTRKTASSSAELILEQLCIPPGFSSDISSGLGGAMHLSDFGIVGARWHASQKIMPNENKYWSHMAAREIYANMPSLFDASLKISCARHPVTKYISAFHHFGGYSRYRASQLKQQNRLELLKNDFLDYVSNVNLSERFVLAIRGKCCVDEFIRQESFDLCMDRVLNRIGIQNPERSDLVKSAPSAKISVKSSQQGDSRLTLATHDYLNKDIVQKISSWTRWDCEVMDYDISVY